MSSQGGKSSVANSHHAHQGFLDVDELALALVFLLGAVRESFLQKDQVSPEFELAENQAAQGFQRVFLIGHQFAGCAIDDAKCAEGVTVFVDQGGAGVKPDVRVGSDERIVAKAFVGEGVGTTKTSGCKMAVEQKAMSREVSRASM